MPHKLWVASFVSLVLLFASVNSATATIKAGTKCVKLAQTSVFAGKKYTCIKSGKKLVWNKGVTFTIKPTPTPTIKRISVNDSEIVVKVTSTNCYAYVPKGWAMMDFQGKAADIYSPDGKVAGELWYFPVTYLGRASDIFYGRDPDLSSPDPLVQALAIVRNEAGGLKADKFVTSGTELVIQGYHGFNVSSVKYKGYVLYYPMQGDKISIDYLNIVRSVVAPIGTTQNALSRYFRAVLSIRCSVQVNPSTDPFTPIPSTDGSSDENSAYNAQLGTEVVHDPATGETYTVSVTEDLSKNVCGTGNEGYAKYVGNDCKVLTYGYGP